MSLEGSKRKGSAFPLEIREGGIEYDRGMTMRDWFAGMALQGMRGKIPPQTWQ